MNGRADKNRDVTRKSGCVTILTRVLVVSSTYATIIAQHNMGSSLCHSTSTSSSIGKRTITRITFNRPHAHNALDREMSDELADAVRKVKKDRECRFLVFRGAGDTFCAGDDIKDFLSWNDEDPYWQCRQYQETAQMNSEDLNCITIAAVDGVCTGGGLELTLTCDFVVATDRSRWGMPEIDWDITPGWGGVTRLQKNLPAGARPRNGI